MSVSIFDKSSPRPPSYPTQPNPTQPNPLPLISNQHHNNIRLSVIPQLLEPTLDVFECTVLANVVNQQSAYSAAVVSRSDGPVPLLARCVPNLSLDGFVFGLN